MGFKVIAVNGSPRVGGNTQQALDIVAERLAAAGIEVEHAQIGNRLLYGCQACDGCRNMKSRRCVYDDGLNNLLEKVWASDGLLIGSPTYFGSMTSATKSFIDRCGYVSRANGNLLKGKIGAPVAIHRRAGAHTVYAQINYFFGVSEMPIATSSYWSVAVARAPGEIGQDEEGIATMRTLGANMAELILKMRG